MFNVYIYVVLKIRKKKYLRNVGRKKRLSFIPEKNKIDNSKIENMDVKFT